MGRGFSPTDLRPSLANRTIPQKVPNVSIYDKEPGYYMILSRIIHDPGYELPRTPLLGTSVNKGKNKGPGIEVVEGI
jgi:hypothetical protein